MKFVDAFFDNGKIHLILLPKARIYNAEKYESYFFKKLNFYEFDRSKEYQYKTICSIKLNENLNMQDNSYHVCYLESRNNILINNHRLTYDNSYDINKVRNCEICSKVLFYLENNGNLEEN